MNLSIIIPVYNEEGNIKILYDKLKSDLNFVKDYELIFVNDGSTDRTLEEINQIKDPNLKIINFDENLGQSAALNKGLEVSKGSEVITMDGDLQNDPSDIKRLLLKLNEGYDVVCGWRHERKDSFLAKKLPSFCSNFLVKLLFDADIKDQGCTLRAYNSKAAKSLNLKDGYHRFIPLLLKKNGFKITNLKVKHHSRNFGSAKHNSPIRFLKGFKAIFEIYLFKQ